MEDNLGLILADVSRLVRRCFDEKARGIGVTRPQWQVLTLLSRHEGIKQGGLAELLDVEAITLCRIVDRLEEANLVERRRDPDDRRAWQLFLMPDAEAMLRQLKPLGDEVLTMALEGVSDAERQALQASLNKIRNNLCRRSTPVE